MGRRQRRRRRQGQGPAAPESALHQGRTTHPVRQIRIRPDWHRPLGWMIVVLAVALAVVNDLAYVAVDLLPGGHSEVYLMLAFVVAGGGTWLLGLFDPPCDPPAGPGLPQQLLLGHHGPVCGRQLRLLVVRPTGAGCRSD